MRKIILEEYFGLLRKKINENLWVIKMIPYTTTLKDIIRFDVRDYVR